MIELLYDNFNPMQRFNFYNWKLEELTKELPNFDIYECNENTCSKYYNKYDSKFGQTQIKNVTEKGQKDGN